MGETRLTKLFNKWWPVARPVSVSPIDFRCLRGQVQWPLVVPRWKLDVDPVDKVCQLIGWTSWPNGVFPACFSSDSSPTVGWKSPKKQLIWEDIFWATFSDHQKTSKSRLEMFETWPGGQQLNLLNIMLLFFSIEPCLQENLFAETVQNPPLKFEGGKMMMFIHVYPFVAGWCVHSFPEWSSVFLCVFGQSDQQFNFGTGSLSHYWLLVINLLYF